MPTLSTRRIRKVFADGEAAPNAHVRGQLLEKLVIYLFTGIPGVRFLRKDIRVANGSEEIDIVLCNERKQSGFSFLPNILLFECKNWNAPVDSISVNHFITKVRTRHVGYGFLIASNGVTGNADDLTAAHQLMQNALIVDNVKIIVLNRMDICSLKNTRKLVELTQDKIAEIILRAI